MSRHKKHFRFYFIFVLIWRSDCIIIRKMLSVFLSVFVVLSASYRARICPQSCVAIETSRKQLMTPFLSSLFLDVPWKSAMREFNPYPFHHTRPHLYPITRIKWSSFDQSIPLSLTTRWHEWGEQNWRRWSLPALGAKMLGPSAVSTCAPARAKVKMTIESIWSAADTSRSTPIIAFRADWPVPNEVPLDLQAWSLLCHSELGCGTEVAFLVFPVKALLKRAQRQDSSNASKYTP